MVKSKVLIAVVIGLVLIVSPSCKEVEKAVKKAKGESTDIEMELSIPKQIGVGSQVTGSISLTNRSKKRITDIKVELERGAMSYIGEKDSWTVSLEPKSTRTIEFFFARPQGHHSVRAKATWFGGTVQKKRLVEVK